MNPQERACGRAEGPDCKYLVSALSYWCDNDACCRERGTKIPGVINCPYYRPEDTSHYWENLAIGLLLTFYTALAILLSWSLILCL